MRHAEEPTDPRDPDLSGAGRRRAVRLAAHIPSLFGEPDLLIAAAANKRSARAFLTLQPLSHKLGKAIDTSFKSLRHAYLAESLSSRSVYKDASIVICWTHRELPALGRDLGARPGQYPDPWDEQVFNLIFDFKYGKRRGPTVTELVQPF
jgi:hypothetical protein